MAGFDLTKLREQISRISTIDDSIRALVEKLNALRGDPAALDAAVADLSTNIDDVIGAINAGTPQPEPDPGEV